MSAGGGPTGSRDGGGRDGRGRDAALRTALALGVGFILLPLLIVVLYSFSSVAYGVFPPPGLSLRWYGHLLQQPAFGRAFVRSLLVGLATWLCFLSIGVQHAAVWGLAAGVLNFVPYIGSIVFTGASAAVGLMQFGNLESAVLIAGISLALHTVSGYVLTPWLTSRTSRMNAVTVFVGVLAWGWLWGVWGLLLGVPILMVVKAVCDRIDDLKPLGELLSS